jgi:hypothetical protein
MGQGKDAVRVYHRQVENSRKSFVFSGPFNADAPLIGGYGGGPAGTAIAAAASFIAAVVLGGEVVHQALYVRLKVELIALGAPLG